MGERNQSGERDEDWVEAAMAILRLADRAQSDGNRQLAERFVALGMMAFDAAYEADIELSAYGWSKRPSARAPH